MIPPTVIYGINLPLTQHDPRVGRERPQPGDPLARLAPKIIICLGGAQPDQFGVAVSALPQHTASRHQGPNIVTQTTNILMFDGNVAKISDLNVSTTLQQLNYTRTGTLTYASP
jgi:prepilin-type processing-associated H-X9-DG protein